MSHWGRFFLGHFVPLGTHLSHSEEKNNEKYSFCGVGGRSIHKDGRSGGCGGVSPEMY